MQSGKQTDKCRTRKNNASRLPNHGGGTRNCAFIYKLYFTQ